MTPLSFKKGIIIVPVLIFGAIAVLVTGALIYFAAALFKDSKVLGLREQAFQIAESGVDYYRWHLAHAPADYQDGTGASGPYVHDYTDKDGTVIGQFTLTITPPPIGSTVVKIKSKGTVTANPSVARTLEVSLGIPSLARYAVVANDVMRFGDGTEIFGPVHSNNGIRFDGLAHNIVTSAKDKYVDPDNGSSFRYGVYTTLSPQDPSPPTAVPARADVFMAGRQFPVPAVDFVGMTTDLSQMKTQATTDSRYFLASGSQGYLIVLKTNDTFDLYKVTSIKAPAGGCTNTAGQTGWGTWTILNKTFIKNHTFPVHGVMFFEDNIWVEGTIQTARLTIAAGRFPDSPATRKSITINKDLLYTYYDGQDSIGLVAQGDINTGLGSLDTMRIDAALIAQNGRAGRYYYKSACGTGYNRTELTLYGMIATNLRYGFAYTDGTGYDARNIIYDANLLYAPPPNFPLTSNLYSIQSWKEVK
ncbi:MAG: hypothetical protein ABI430_03205 [Candidatus Taylorbacteria bacterium]